MPQGSHADLAGKPFLAGKVVWVVDANSLIFQVFHAIPEMTSPAGQPVNAVFGFTRDMLYLLEAKKPDYLVAAFDLPGPTFRHAIYEAYKAKRAEMPEALAPQFAPIRQVLLALGIPILERDGFEADDILATIARRTERLGGECRLVSGDKDCRQLLSARVKIFNVRKNALIDAGALRAEWGIRPDQVVDYQTLVGDPVDNIPGVPLIGPKGASELLQKFDTLEGIYEHVGEINGEKRKQNLLASRATAANSRQLVKLLDDVPIEMDWDHWQAGRLNVSELESLFQEFGFHGFRERVAALAKQPDLPAASANYHTIDTPEALRQLVDELARQPRFSFDTETTHVWPRHAELVGCSFSWHEGEAYYLPLRGPAGAKTLDLKSTLETLRGVLESPDHKKIGQNLKFDMIALRTSGLRMAGIEFDTMVASYLLDAGERIHNLDELAQRYLHHTTVKISELIGTGKNQKRMDEVPIEKISYYAAEDADVPWRLWPILDRRLRDEQLDELFHTLEMPLIEVLAEMEYTGIKVDVARLTELSQQLGELLEKLEAEIFELAGHPLNIASPKQLQAVLFDEQKLPVIKRTKTGPSTDADVLQELARLHPLPAKIVEHRQYAKLKGTYVDALPAMVHPTTGRIHASFHQEVAATGRLSSSDPNLQNIPIRTEIGKEIRSAFVPGEPGWKLLTADYSQIELRVLAHFSGDATLCAAFERDEDIHARVAAEVFGVPLDQVTSQQRRTAKAVNFGVIYGQSPFGLSKTLGIEQDVAAEFIDAYFRKYPGVDEFLLKVLAQCAACGYVGTILGRRRAIQGVRSPAELAAASRQRNLPERTAINTVIQGSAADLIKKAMISIHRRLADDRLSARMLLQIHDELVFEVPSDHVHDLARLVVDEMTGVLPLAVPLKVDVEAGDNWRDCQPLAD